MKRILFHENSRNGKVGGSHHSLLLMVKNLDPTRFEKIVMLNSDMALRPEFEKHSRVIIWTGPSASYFAGQGLRQGWYSTFSTWPAPLGKPMNVGYRYARMFYNDIILGAGVIKNYILLLKREKIDIVHLNNSFDRYWNLSARLAGVPVVQHVRGISDCDFSALCHWTAKVICISENIKKEVLLRGLDPQKVVRIYNAVDCRSFAPTRSPQEVRAELGIGPDEHMVSLFGNIQSWKGQETLLKAGIRLKEKCKNIRVVFFGEVIQEDYAASLHKLAEAAGINNNVVFAGYKYDVENWMNCSDIVIHASIAPEPFGRVLIEAMILGKPVIGTNLGAVPEIVEDNVSGLLFEAGDDEQLAERIDFLLAHPEEGNRLGQNAVRRVRQCFDVEQHIAAITKIYDELLWRKKR